MKPQHPHRHSPDSLTLFALFEFFVVLTPCLVFAVEPAPPRLTRANSFLGIHFDFHAGSDCKEIGKNTTPAMVENIINLVHPDYLQIDCKGHPGLSSYPTKVGNQAPGFVGDPLRTWRNVTADRGVALFLHYSGVWDSEAIVKHPDWGAVNADGKVNGNATSFYSPYVDQLLIPQLRELAGAYGIDGVWVDGECWASVPDYGVKALEDFKRATGYQEVPRKPGDAHWYEFLEFNRDAFRRYLRHYITEVKKTNPDFQLCSNWAFTDHMPEQVCAPVDFLSGDYSPQDSVNSARLSARYLARQGKPWDLMAWSFTTQPGKGGGNEKTAIQLEREAAVVLALGGGFQAYFAQKRDGSIHDERMPVMAEVARFCRARQAFCHHAVQVPQIALLYSTAAHYRTINGLFSRDSSGFNGTLDALLEAQCAVELLGEHQLTGRMTEYPLIIIPEWPYLETQFRTELVNYVKQGGNLLVIGPNAARLFEHELDAAFRNPPTTQPRVLRFETNQVTLNVAALVPDLGAKAKPFGALTLITNSSSAAPAASVAKLGKGKIAACYFNFSRSYEQNQNPVARQFLVALARQLFPKPLVEITGSSDVDLVVNRIQGKLAINLVNTSGPHRSEPILDSIQPVGPLTVRIRQPKKPHRLTLQPVGQELPFRYKSGVVEVTVPMVSIHDILMVD